MKWLLAASLVLAVACGPSSSSRDGSASTPAAAPAGGGSAGPSGAGSPDAGSPPAPAPTPPPAPAPTPAPDPAPSPAPAPGSGNSAPAAPERLATNAVAFGIALDDRNVYWAHSENEGGWKHWHYSIHAVPKAGGTVITIAEGAGDMMTPLVARDGFVYWSMATCPQDCERFDFKTYLYRVPRNGGAVQELKVETNLRRLAVDGQRIYYRARYGGDGNVPGLWSVGVDGTNPRRLTTNPAGEGPVLVGDMLYFLDRGDNPDSTFWTSLRAVPAAGGNIVEVRTETNTLIAPYTMTVHRGIAFANAQVVDGNAGPVMQQAAANEAGVWRVPFDGSAWMKILEGPRFVLLDANGGRIYWVRDGCFGSADLDGNDSHCIDEGGHTYGSLAVDDASVFFVRDGDLYRLPRE